MKNMKKLLVMLACVTLLLTFTVSGTVAFLADGSNPVVNEFTPTSVTPGIEEDFDGKEKKNVYITNSGNIAAYVRAAVVITLQNSDGSVILPAVESTHYTINWGTDWIPADGLYYWPSPVDAGGNTGNLIVSCVSIPEKIPEGYNLHVEVMAQAIQAQPTSVVADEWNVTVNDDKTITP